MKAIDQIKAILDSPIEYSEAVTVGWRLLVATKRKEEKTAGGLYLPERTKREQDGAAMVGRVVGVGPEAYKTREGAAFSVPWCKLGDLVFFKSYIGHVVPNEELPGYILRSINDVDIVKCVHEGDLSTEESFIREEDYSNPTYSGEQQ